MYNKFKLLAMFSSLLLTPIVGVAADFNLRFQTAYSEEETAYKMQKVWLDGIEKETNGKLKITLLPSGAVVKYNQTMDAMRLNLLDGHISLAAFNADKEPAFTLLTNTVGTWTSGSQASDFMSKEGSKLLSHALKKQGIHLIGTFNENIESFVSSRPTNGPEDLNGLKLRVADPISSAAFQHYGAVPKSLPFTQVVEGLKQGAIDGGDLSSLTDNQILGANDLAPNPIYPGFHSPILDVSVSQRVWDSLPADLQIKLTESTKQYANTVLQQSIEKDQKTLQELSKNNKITVNNWSQAERKKFRKTVQEQWKKVATESALASETYNKLMAYLKANNLL